MSDPAKVPVQVEVYGRGITEIVTVEAELPFSRHAAKKAAKHRFLQHHELTTSAGVEARIPASELARIETIQKELRTLPAPGFAAA